MLISGGIRNENMSGSGEPAYLVVVAVYVALGSRRCPVECPGPEEAMVNSTRPFMAKKNVASAEKAADVIAVVVAVVMVVVVAVVMVVVVAVVMSSSSSSRGSGNE